MHMVLRFFDPDQIAPSFSKKRRHKSQHAQRAARGTDLVYGEPQSRFVLNEVDSVFGLVGLPKVDLRRKPKRTGLQRRSD